MPRRKALAVLLSVALIAGLGMPAQAWAGRTRIHEAAESDVYGRKMGGMLGRGVLNVLTSFVDVIVNTVNETRNGPPVVGTFTGLGRGLGCGLLRFGSGAIDVTTFWVPDFNGVPVSHSYSNCFAQSNQAYSQQPMPVPQQQVQPDFSYAQPQELPTPPAQRQQVQIPTYQQEPQQVDPPVASKDKPRWSK